MLAITYRRAARELETEAVRLRKLNTLILRALENNGLAKLAMVPAGEIIGLNFELNAEPGHYSITGYDAELKVERPGDADA